MNQASRRWRNRIVGYGEESPDQLLANPRNFRIHPKPQQDALLGALREVGIVQDVIVNRTNGCIVDGHLRVMLGISDEQPKIPVKYVELTPAEEALILATLDPISAMAGLDGELFARLLDDVSTGEAGLQALIDSLAVQTGIAPPDDPLAEWQGMPEFEQEDLRPHRTLKVHFADEDAAQAFAGVVGQALTEKTRSIWYPEQTAPSQRDTQYVSDGT